MNEWLKNRKIILVCILLVLISGCSKKPDFSGVFTYSSGGCKDGTIVIKKVMGFGDKYYLVTLYNEDKPSGSEFLGTVSGNRIDLQNGSILMKDGAIEVTSGGKKCLYISTD